MTLRFFSVPVVVLVLFCAPVFGQQRGQASPNPGINPTTIMDMPEVRVARVQVAAGAVRNSHVHSDVPFHLFVPITGPIQLLIGPEGKQEMETVEPGQVHFFRINTPHGFKNPGSNAVTVIEIFVRAPANGRVDKDSLGALARALGALR